MGRNQGQFEATTVQQFCKPWEIWGSMDRNFGYFIAKRDLLSMSRARARSLKIRGSSHSLEV